MRTAEITGFSPSIQMFSGCAIEPPMLCQNCELLHNPEPPLQITGGFTESCVICAAKFETNPPHDTSTHTASRTRAKWPRARLLCVVFRPINFKLGKGNKWCMVDT